MSFVTVNNLEAVNQLEQALAVSDIEKNKDKRIDSHNKEEYNKQFDLDYDDYGNIILYSNEVTEKKKYNKKQAMIDSLIKSLEKNKNKKYSKDIYKFNPYDRSKKNTKKIPGARRFDHTTPSIEEKSQSEEEELDDLYYIDYFYYDK